MHEAPLPQDFHFFERGWRIPGRVDVDSKWSDEMDAATAQGILHFEGTNWRTAIPNDDTFTQFLDLANATPRQILGFARRFGPIGLERRPGVDDEWRPQGVGPISGRVVDGRLYLSEVFGSNYDIPSFQIRTWRGRARWTKRLLDLATQVRGQIAIPENDWQQVEDMIQTVRFDSSIDLSNIVQPILDNRKLEPEEKMRRFEKLWHEMFDDWRRKYRYKRPTDLWERLTHATAAVIGGRNPIDLPMFFRFRQGRLTFSFSSSLGAYLKLQTLYVIGMEADVVLCAGCHKLFPSKRHPPAGRRAWCPKCGRRAASKDAMRRMRERQRQHSQHSQEAEI